MTSIQDLLRTDVPLSYGATAVYPYSPKLEKRFRFETHFGDEVLLHRVEDEFIHLPRAVCPIGGKDERLDGMVVHYKKSPVPRDYQVPLFLETAAFLKEGKSGIVVAATGWGKTALGFHAAAVVQRKTIVITTKDDIYKQWLTDAKTFLGLEDHEIGEIRQDKCEVKGTKFVVAMIHSLSIDGKYPAWIDEEFGLAIFDECHRVPADQFSAVIDMFRAKLRLGLSATPERADGKELMLYAHIGPIRAQSEVQLLVPKVLRFNTGWQCPRVIRTDKETGKKRVVRLPHEPGKTMHLEKMLAADPPRNHMIANAIAQAYSKGRRIVVFSSTHEHLRALHRASVALGVPGKQTGFYIGANTKADREARDKVKARPVMFTTWSMMAEGTNIPWLDTAVLAAPRSNVNQPIGRIRREYDGKKYPVVMDFVDSDSPVFAGYANRREQWYASIGAEIVEMAA